MFKTFSMGADVCNAARPFLFSLGCIQALKCHTNKCPTGITTQDQELVFGLDPTLKSARYAALTLNLTLTLTLTRGTPP